MSYPFEVDRNDVGLRVFSHDEQLFLEALGRELLTYPRPRRALSELTSYELEIVQQRLRQDAETGPERTRRRARDLGFVDEELEQPAGSE